jgi:hypothetical protein
VVIINTNPSTKYQKMTITLMTHNRSTLRVILLLVLSFALSRAQNNHYCNPCYSGMMIASPKSQVWVYDMGTFTCEELEERLRAGLVSKEEYLPMEISVVASRILRRHRPWCKHPPALLPNYPVPLLLPFLPQGAVSSAHQKLLPDHQL